MCQHKIEFDCKCDACGATGLFVGMGERSGAAVVCNKCKGTGKVHRVVEYEDFNGRRKREGVRRVYRTNPGICIGEDDELGLWLEDFGGIDVDEWERGVEFAPGTEDRRHTCPAWFYQSADCAKKPDWRECWKSLGSSFSRCPYFKYKASCWERWDRENVTA